MMYAVITYANMQIRIRAIDRIVGVAKRDLAFIPKLTKGQKPKDAF